MHANTQSGIHDHKRYLDTSKAISLKMCRFACVAGHFVFYALSLDLCRIMQSSSGIELGFLGIPFL